MAMHTLLTKVRQRILERALHTLSLRRRRILAWRSMLESDVQSVTIERGGIIWTVRPIDSGIEFSLFVDGNHQQREVLMVLDWMRRCGVLSPSRNVVVDVGAKHRHHLHPPCSCRGLSGAGYRAGGGQLQAAWHKRGGKQASARDRLVQKAVLREPGKVRLCVLEDAGGTFVWRDGQADVAPGAVAGYETVDGEPLTTIVGSAGIAAEEVALVGQCAGLRSRRHRVRSETLGTGRPPVGRG